MMTFIRSLANVQRVRLISRQPEITNFVKGYDWTGLINECVRLDRVIIQLVGDGDLTKEAEDIEQELRAIRPEMIFRIKGA